MNLWSHGEIHLKNIKMDLSITLIKIQKLKYKLLIYILHQQNAFLLFLWFLIFIYSVCVYFIFFGIRIYYYIKMRNYKNK